MNKFLPFNIFKYQLYIFQLEEYDASRYLKSLLAKGLLQPKNLRKTLTWTTKAKVLLFIAIIIEILLSLAFSYLIYSIFSIAEIFWLLILISTFYFLNFLSFLFFIQAQDLIYPLELLAKKRIINKAKNTLKTYPNIKIVGITGSYGKTTMKETVSTILGEKFNIVKTKGNNNTPIGISRTILNDLNSQSQIFIVEMGEYVKGDVKDICNITPPDFSIITGINEAHLERYKTMENAISTKFEIIENAKENAQYLLNSDDELILKNFKEYVKDKNRLHFYSSHEIVDDKKAEGLKFDYTVQNIEFNQSEGAYTFEMFYQNNSIGTVKTQILAPYIIGNITAATTLAKLLGMSDTEIRLGISKLRPVEHRLEPKISSNNILVIDDTYNGNSDGIKIGLELLNKFNNRRKVYVTPGLVETGSLTKEIHIKIGEDLAKVADLVILLKNSVTPYIFEGLKNAGFSKENVIWYDYSKEMYSNLHRHLKPNDVVLMQNDWSDNYS